MSIGDKLKGFDAKAFFINHAEKVGLGIVALICLFALLGTRWAGFSEIEPEALKQKVTTTRERVKSSDWPDEEREKFAMATDLKEEAEGLFEPINISSYRYSQDFIFPVYEAVEKSRDPVYLKPEEMIADVGRVVIAMRLDPAEQDVDALGELGEGLDGTVDDEDVDNEFAPRRRSPGGGGTGDFGDDETLDADYATGGGTATELGPGEGDDADPEADFGEGYGEAGEFSPGEGDEFGDDEGGGGVTPTERAQGFRYIAVRAVFDLKSQAEEIRKALSISGSRPVTEIAQILDFELERKRAVAGPDPWVGDWEGVDRGLAEEVLTQSVDWESEVVELGVTDPSITMPLPARMMGQWGEHATHPKVENFELSPEEQQQQEALIAKALDAIEKKKAELGPAPVQKGGFSRITRDTAQISSIMDTSFLRGAQTEILGNKKQDPEDAKARMEKLKRGAAAGNVVLFRYFDFDVVPGNAYIYRLRFVLKNQNFGKRPDELVDPESANGQTRTTPWLAMGKPIIVEPDADYFLARVNPRNNAATLNMYEWLSDTGTLVNGSVEVVPGQFVGGKTRTEVLRPAEQTFEQEEIVLNSQDVLVDTFTAPQLQPDMHPELTLTGRSRSQNPIVDTTLVMDSNGRLVLVDPLSSVSRQRKIQDTLDRMAAANEDLKDSGGDDGDSEGVDALRELGGGYEGGGDEDGMEEGGGGVRRRGSSRRSSSRRRSTGR